MPEDYFSLFDRSGNSTNTVVVDGQLAGVRDCPADEAVVRFFLFEEAGESTRKSIVAQRNAWGSSSAAAPWRSKNVVPWSL